MTEAPKRNISIEEIDKQTFMHPYTPFAQHLRTGPRVMASGGGCRLKDIHGKEYIDGLAGLWCVNVGYGRDEIVEAITKQAKQLAYYHSFASMGTEPPIRLAERLLEMGPSGMSKIFFANSGSEANDTIVKLVWYYNNLRGQPNKRKIIARRRAYHGVTVAAGSLTGLPTVHKAFNLPIDGVLHVEPPYPYWGQREDEDPDAYARRLAKELDERIQAEGPETVGAFIAEPVMGAGGVIVPPKTYFKHVQEVLKKHDVLMVADEVICGFGRLGHMFGSFAFDIEPDLVSFAKGVTSGYLPLSGCYVSDKVWDVLLEHSDEIGPFGHGYTYSAHPISAAAALANLDIIEREGLVDNAARVGAYLHKRLEESVAGLPMVGETRGMGLIAGIELVADKAKKTCFDPKLGAAKRVNAHALESGLIARPVLDGDVLALSPPLSLTESDVDEIVERIEAAIKKTADELSAEVA